jgi:hypothetical protein
LATKLGTFHWPPSLEHSIGHQALDLPSPSFPFSLKGGLKSLGALFPKTYFQSNLKDSCSYKLLKEGENDQPWELGKGRRVEWKSCNGFKGMEMSSDRVGRLKP